LLDRDPWNRGETWLCGSSKKPAWSATRNHVGPLRAATDCRRFVRETSSRVGQNGGGQNEREVSEERRDGAKGDENPSPPGNRLLAGHLANFLLDRFGGPGGRGHPEERDGTMKRLQRGVLLFPGLDWI